jgi:hypothetical protein
MIANYIKILSKNILEKIFLWIYQVNLITKRKKKEIYKPDTLQF